MTPGEYVCKCGRTFTIGGGERLADIGAAQQPYWDDPLKAVNVQMLCLAEEAGEAVRAYRQWAGLARRHDATIEDLGEELADVIITATHAAFLLGVDLDVAVWEKLHAIEHRRMA